MTPGSAQQQRYLLARFVEKLSRDDAAFEAGIGPVEASLIDKDVGRGILAAPTVAPEPAATPEPTLAPVLPLHAARAHLGADSPPIPATASRLLAAITPKPDPDTNQPAAARSEDPAPTPEKETTMPRGAAAAKQTSTEVAKPDFERAVRIFRADIKPANEKSGEHAQAASTGYKAIKKDCHVNTRAAKFVFQLAGESEEKRDDVLRSVRGLLKAMNIGITNDLVSQAEAEDSSQPIIPTARPEGVKLATVN